MSGPGIGAAGDRGGRSIPDAVSLADVAPTAMRLLGFSMSDVDGIDVRPAFAGAALGRRELCAESLRRSSSSDGRRSRASVRGPGVHRGAGIRALRSRARRRRAAERRADQARSGRRSRDALSARYSSDTPWSGRRRAFGPARRRRLRALGCSSGSSPREYGRRLTCPIRSAGQRELAARICAGDLRLSFPSGRPSRRALDGIDPRKPGQRPGPAATRLRPPGTRRAARRPLAGLSRGHLRRPAVRRRVPGSSPDCLGPTGRSGSRRRGVDRGTADRAGQSGRGEARPRSPSRPAAATRGRGD